LREGVGALLLKRIALKTNCHFDEAVGEMQGRLADIWPLKQKSFTAYSCETHIIIPKDKPAN
jgi:hypothetical protein